MIKAIIFDFDGLLVNTQEMLILSWEEILKRRGVKFDPSDNQILIGRPGPVNVKFLLEKYNLKESPDDFLAERRQISHDLFENRLALMEGVLDLLRNAKRWGVFCAVGSSGFRQMVEGTLRKLDIFDYFKVIVCQEDLRYSEGKPDPEVYLIVAKKLKLDSQDCLVLEDAPVGILAAKAAGMKAVYVPNPNLTDPHHDQADLILRSLTDLNEMVFKSLSKG